MALLFENAVLLDPDAGAPRPGSLLIEGERIEALATGGLAVGPDVERRDLGGQALAPGFLDVHYHGALVFDAGLDDALREAASLVRHGTTGYLATTVAWQHDALVSRVESWVSGLERAPKGAKPLGIHLEGPWIRAAAAGAQPSAGIRDFDRREAEAVLSAGAGQVRMITLAPEIRGADELLELLASRGIPAALGHSLADAATVTQAIERGARHATHLFNAMGPIHHREPGLAGTALADDRLSADLICDGAHVHPQMVRAAARALGERLILITDRVDPGPGADFGSGALHDDGTALRLPDGRLAGSRLTLDRAIQNATRFADLGALDAVAACTLRPACLLGIEAERGSLRPGARADLVVLDRSLQVRETWLGGECVFEA
jgi:N-acetylglucosamine-6-phosphate deacetylase